MSRAVSMDDLTRIQRKYLQHLNRVRLGLRPSHAQVPSDKSISVLLDLRLIEPHRTKGQGLAPYSMCVWVLTERGANLVEQAAP